VIGRGSLLQRLILLLPCCFQPALAQLPPPLPDLPGTISSELGTCVARYGNTGCAARLYARLLCDSVGRFTSSAEMELRLADQYEQAAIDFRGINPEQVETAAVRYYSPMLCPQKSPQIRRLFEGI
jgi:hypothetical protein